MLDFSSRTQCNYDVVTAETRLNQFHIVIYTRRRQYWHKSLEGHLRRGCRKGEEEGCEKELKKKERKRNEKKEQSITLSGRDETCSKSR